MSVGKVGKDGQHDGHADDHGAGAGEAERAKGGQERAGANQTEFPPCPKPEAGNSIGLDWRAWGRVWGGRAGFGGVGWVRSGRVGLDWGWDWGLVGVGGGG